MPKPRPLLGGAQLTALLGDGSVLSQYNPTFRERATDAIRSLLFSDDREGQRKAERVSNVFETVTPYGVATGVDDASEAFGRGDYATAGTMFAMAGLPGPSPKGIRAFHGSPHSFDKFSMDKIGTGEGAQAYGHGLYFADSEGVAKSYRDALSPSKVAIGGQMVDSPTFFKAARRSPSVDDNIAMLTKQRENILKEMAANTSDPELGDFVSELYDVQLKDVDKEIAELSQYKGGWFGTRPGGSMYEVNINADPDSFLDWDKPLSEQPESVRNKLLGPGGLLGDIQNNPYAMDFLDPHINGEFGTLTGGELVSVLKRLGENEYLPVNGPNVAPHMDGGNFAPAISGTLRNEGIPGIKYLDAGSRGMNPPSVKPNNGQYEVYWGNDPRPVDTFPTKEAAEAAAREIDGRSRNYVVFDDKLISIVRKYGIAGASAMLGYNVLSGMSEAQAAQLKEAERK